MPVELGLLILSLLFFVSIFTDKVGSRFGIPALLLFLVVGMLFGPEGVSSWFGSKSVAFSIDVGSAQAMSTIALSVILFSGGLNTSIGDIRPVAGPGVTLATLGVLLTAFITGGIIYFVFGWIPAMKTITFAFALLMASTMSSTDSASVFSILRTRNISLKHNLQPMLELESGANDPMAYILTITLIGIVTAGKGVEISALELVQEVFIQLVVGAVLGYIFGKIAIFLLKNVSLSNESLYPLMIFTFCIFSFAASYYMRGNPYLAVYISGLVIGNTKFVRKRQTTSFFDGLTWLSQLLMFLMLGLMVRPSAFLHLNVWLPCVIISLVMMFIARPLSVWLSLAPFGKQFNNVDKLFISWVGLKGAVPIIFAILCMANEVPQSELIFNVVFLCTLVSLLAQGSSLTKVANSLHLATPRPKEKRLVYFDIDLPEEIQTSASEIMIKESDLANGNQIKDLSLPQKTLIIMVRRGESFFVPVGTSVLMKGDQLLLISDRAAKEAERKIDEDDEFDLNQWSEEMKAKIQTKVQQHKEQLLKLKEKSHNNL